MGGLEGEGPPRSFPFVPYCERRALAVWHKKRKGKTVSTTIGAIVRGDQAIFPPYLYEAYRSTIRGAPSLPLVDVPLPLSELTGPGPAISAVTPEDADLTRNAGTSDEAIGQRIIVTGRVLDDQGNPIPNTLLEIWQANAAGRYLHKRDQWPGPLDP